MGKWRPIYTEEYNGDTPIDSPAQTPKFDAGELIFRDSQLPWAPGRYELRYHHDGKHNVMSRASLEIFGGH